MAIQTVTHAPILRPLIPLNTMEYGGVRCWRSVWWRLEGWGGVDDPSIAFKSNAQGGSSTDAGGGGGGGGRLAGPEYYFSSSTIWAHVPVLTGGEIGICFTDPGGNINESFTGPGLFFHWPEGGGERVGRGGGGGVCAGCPTDGGGP